MMTLYDFAPSGNCYKVRLLLNQLHLPYKKVSVDRIGGETRTPSFLALNSNGKIPLLRLESGEFLPESNAILFYLAEGTSLLPENKLERARVLQWMFFEQYSHAPNIAIARFWISIIKKEKEYEAQLVEKHALGNQALDVMEEHLKKHPFFVGDRYSVADISLYAYTHVASQGKFDLSKYPTVSAWLSRVQDQPDHLLISN